MYTDVKKLDLIERLLKEKNEEVLKTVEDILSKPLKQKHSRFYQFTNKLTKEELDNFKKNIEIGCEQINEADWQ